MLDTFQINGTPDPVTGKSVTSDVELYQYFSSGRLATMELISPQGADNVDPWKIVTDSFRWTA